MQGYLLGILLCILSLLVYLVVPVLSCCSILVGLFFVFLGSSSFLFYFFEAAFLSDLAISNCCIDSCVDGAVVFDRRGLDGD